MQATQNNIEDIYPLSPMQEGVLFHTIYSPNSGAYLDQMNFTLQGELDSALFARAWQRVMARHSALRSVFVWENRDKPLQVVRQTVTLTLAQQDWREHAPVEQQQRLEAFLREDRRRGFKLTEAPLMRLALIRTADDFYQLVWTYHHLLLDGWSLPLLLKEVAFFYEALRRGEDRQLAPSRPFRDYIAWLKQQDLSQAGAFWRRTLKGFSAPTPLGDNGVAHAPADREKNFKQQEFKLPAAATQALQAFARQNQMTLNTLVQGAWALLLSRYSGENDVLFGAIVSGRPAELAGIEAMVGLFINTLPVRVQISPQEKLVPWLKKLQGDQFDLRQYEYSPLVDVQGWSEVPRGVPLFESVLVFSNYPEISLLDEGSASFQMGHLRAIEQTHYPLTAFGIPGRELKLWMICDADRFGDATVTRMLAHWANLLAGMAANPNASLAELSLLSPPEKRQLLVEWNDTQSDYPAAQCFHELFAAQVERTPDAIAAVFEDQQLTYRELDRRANQLAQRLRKMGAGPETLAGVCMERSLEMLIALLGVFKAGAAYVPLDPAFPEARLAYMLQDAQIVVLLTTQLTIDNLQLSIANCKLVLLDTDWNEISRESTIAPENTAAPENLAYVIYTSGSTGKPKGVAIPHLALVNFLASMQQTPGMAANDVLLSVTTLSFDIAGLELYLPLLVGGRVVLASREVTRDAAKLIALIQTSNATVMQATPATWRMLLDADWSGSASLKILAGGEAVPKELVERLLPKGASLWNMYGPTETTIWSTTGQLAEKNSTITIGRPIANTQIYLLDERMRPAPIGIAGALQIGGDGVARGYLNRPELTAEKFVPNLYAESPGSRMYDTGDLAKYQDDGNIEFLGRNDFQVKLRGFRIELGEIEAALAQHPGVKQSVVLVREDVPGDQRLVAYLTANFSNPPAVEDLRLFLINKLPEYMIPSAFIFLESFPLTPNGKVNRRALPAPDHSRQSLETSYVAPRTEIERTIAAIWREALRAEQVGLHDNFFDLGGHSLLMTQVYGKIRKAFDRDITMIELFKFPTVSAMAKYLSSSGQATAPATENGQDRAAMRRAAMERRKHDIR